jgi:predicted ribosome quality control (RQC) complex YloA/Tae2 family protein
MKLTAELVSHMARQLANELSGARFAEAYSTGNEELTILFNTTSGIVSFTLIWKYHSLYILHATQPKAKPTPHYSFFNELAGLTTTGVYLHPQNRSFHIELENGFVLFFKLYGALGNVLLFQNHQLLYHFKKSITADYQVSWTAFCQEHAPVQATPDEPKTDFWYELNREKTDELRLLHFTQQKQQLLSTCRSEIKRLQRIIEMTQKGLEEQRSRIPDEEIGHIIMANLHRMSKGITHIELDDFYRNQPISIKLKETLTPQENAEFYYRKARNRKAGEQELENKIQQAQQRLSEWQLLLTQTETATRQSELKKFTKRVNVTDTAQQGKGLCYHLFTWDGYQIRVGKKAAANDELTFKLASKNDWWLHAKDVSGSHVIIKAIDATSELPVQVLEFAASLAAGFSGAKSSLLVPVMYTRRKYVRKPKGAAPGEVLCEHYRLTMATPYKKTRGPEPS